MSVSFELLEGHRYMRMTTYRRYWEVEPTTVWFAIVDGRVYVFTGMHTGKAKRIRNNPRVRLTHSNFIGRPRVQSSVEARLMDKDEEAVADRAISEKYGWQYRLYNYGLGLPRTLPEHVFLELRPVEDDAAQESVVRPNRIAGL